MIASWYWSRVSSTRANLRPRIPIRRVIQEWRRLIVGSAPVAPGVPGPREQEVDRDDQERYEHLRKLREPPDTAIYLSSPPVTAISIRA